MASSFLTYYRRSTAKEISALPEIGINIKCVESTLLRLTRLLRVAAEVEPPAVESFPKPIEIFVWLLRRKQSSVRQE